jgi:hypothetical protein
MTTAPKLDRFAPFDNATRRLAAVHNNVCTKIEAAFVEIIDNQTTIAAVQTALDGKNAIFRATSAPTATATGDLWLDSDDGDKPYRWDGVSWVAVQDIGAAYARLGVNSDGTIKADKVVSGSIVAGVVLSTPGGAQTSSTTITSAATWTDCDDVTVTMSGTEATVRVDFNVEVIDNCKYNYRLLYDGTTLGREVGPITVNTGDQPGASITRRHTPSAGSHTYKLQAYCNDASNIIVHDPVFDLTENNNL